MVLDFSVESEEQSKIPIIRINGEIDIYNAPKLNDFFKNALDVEHAVVVLNLENVQYIDSTGLGTIAQAAYRLSQKNGKLHIVCTRPSIKKIFEVSGLIQKNIVLFDSENAALNNK